MMATHDQWLDAYETCYGQLPGVLQVPCPHCGNPTLRLVFTGHPETMVGYASFWCDTCLNGIGISRAPIPEGAVMQDIRDAPEDRTPKVPNYRLVH
jgi:hypothetical protein